jgi:hypothetical protein
MKLFAQDGHQPSDKIARGLQEGFIQGVILSAKYTHPDQCARRVAELIEIMPSADILIDPEFYAARMIGTPNCSLRHLEDWPFFRPYRRNELIGQQAVISRCLRDAISSISEMRPTAVICPSVYISASFDSFEAAATLAFAQQCRPIADELHVQRPIYATMAIHHAAFERQQELKDYLDILSRLRPRPDGFYLIVGGGTVDETADIARSDLLKPTVLAGWMLMNYVLRQNGFSVINGFSDLNSPLLAAASCNACATGWWTTLQTFAMSRYLKQPGKGGAQPLTRYLSCALLARPKRQDYEAFRTVVSEVRNNLRSDMWFDDNKRIVTRTEEALQTWDVISSLCNPMTEDISANLHVIQRYRERSRQTKSRLTAAGFTEDQEAHDEYLTCIEEAVKMFVSLAEL